MIKTFFYLITDKQNEAGESAIFAKIQLQGKSTTLSTGKFVSKERWKSTNKLKNTLRLNTEKLSKSTMDLLETKIETIYLELSKSNSIATLDDVKNKLNGKTFGKSEIDILTLFQKHNEYFKKKFIAGERSKASLQKYNRAKDLLTNYIKVKHGKTSYKITEIDNQFVYNLESYLRYESSFNDKVGISHNNSVVKYFKSFKTVCNYGIKRNLITANPFLCYDENLNATNAFFLTIDELRRIETKEFSSHRLNKVKDIFLFSCYTGYAPVDVRKLSRNNLIKDSEGTYWIETYRTKTHIKSNVPVLPPVKRIIDKYANLDDNKLLPNISNQKVNEYLKEIADLCGIDKNLTHYVARHTFGTTVTLGNGVAIENVPSMMGHSGIKMTQHYAKNNGKKIFKIS